MAEMAGLLKGSIPGFLDALRRRWLVALGMAAVLSAAYAVAHSSGAPLAWPRTLEIVLTSALTLCVFADAMRIADPSYRVTGQRFWMLVWVTVVFSFALLVAEIPAFVLFANHQAAIGTAVTVVIGIFVMARLGFAWFLADLDASPVFYSWLLTRGPALLPSLVPAALSWLPSELTNGIGRIALPGATAQALVVRTTLIVASTLLSCAWLYPLLARWLPICQRINEVRTFDPQSGAADANLT
jgi:hypothetical protein